MDLRQTLTALVLVAPVGWGVLGCDEAGIEDDSTDEARAGGGEFPYLDRPPA